MTRTLHALALAVAVVSLSACAGPPDSLHVVRVLTGTAVGQFDAFDRTIAEPATVRDLEAIVRSLPPARRDVFCPIAWGHSYRLTFQDRGTPTLVATVEADGCRVAHLGPTDARATTDSFWATLATALGFSPRGNDLFPLPRDTRHPA